MKTVVVLIKKEILRFLADKPALIFAFVLPPVLILIFGLIFGNIGESSSKIPILFVNNSTSKVAKYFEEKLDSSKAIKLIKEYKTPESKTLLKLDEKKAVEFVKAGNYSTAVVLPPDFISDTSNALRIKIFYDPKNEIEFSLIQGVIQKSLYTTLAPLFPYLMQRKAVSELSGKESQMFTKDLSNVISKYFNVDKDTVRKYTSLKNPEALLNSNSGSGNFFQDLIKVESKQVVGEEVPNPGVARSVGGWASMFLLFSIVSASLTLFEEKQEGSLKRLLCMPVRRSHILWSKYIYSTLLGIVQLILMFLFAWVVFGLDIFTNFANLLIMIVASSMAAVAFGMLITSFAKSISQAHGIATILILLMSALGGAWFPVFLLPEWMQTIAKSTITYWSVNGFLQVLWRNSNFAGIATNVLILASVGIILTFYSVIRFRKGNIF